MSQQELSPASLKLPSLVCLPSLPFCILGDAFGRDSVFSNILFSLFPFSCVIGVPVDRTGIYHCPSICCGRSRLSWCLPYRLLVEVGKAWIAPESTKLWTRREVSKVDWLISIKSPDHYKKNNLWWKSSLPAFCFISPDDSPYCLWGSHVDCYGDGGWVNWEGNGIDVERGWQCGEGISLNKTL